MRTLKCIVIILMISLLFSGVCFAATDETNTNSAEPSELIELTQEEKDFIAEHPVIRLGVDPAFVPYEFFDNDGAYKGIAADYIGSAEQHKTSAIKA